MTLIESYIAEQPLVVPACWRAAEAEARAFPGGSAGRLVMVGTGTSRHALIVAGRLMRRRLVEVVGSVDYLARPGQAEPEPVVVLSQSGASETTVRAAERARESGSPVLALTAEAGSPLAALENVTRVIPIGEERIGPKTKGFTGSIAALLALAGDWRAPSPEALASDLAEARLRAEALFEHVAGKRFLLIGGMGPMEGVALEAALKITEISGLPAAACDTDELLHGRLQGIGPDAVAVILAANAAEKAVADRASEVMGRRGTRLVVVDLADDGADAARLALRAIFPWQYLAVALAHARGVDPDEMPYPGLSRDLAIKLPSPRRA